LIKLNGRFWLEKDGHSFLGAGRVELLKRIESTGSMNAAAKEMKMSYKAAWERLNSMNELAQKPLLERQTGGKGGGGTKLTPYAYEMIETYEKLEALHRQFIERFSEASDSPEHLAKILNRLFLTTSARNQLLCKIIEISYDNVYAKITLQLGQTQKLISTITAKSMQSLNLKVGDNVYAIIKSSDVKVSKAPFIQRDDSNFFETEILGVESNESKSELHLRLDDERELIAVVNHETSQGMRVGDKLFCVIEHNSIIIGM
jgi:molybdate transport system regulatory protein